MLALAASLYCALLFVLSIYVLVRLHRLPRIALRDAKGRFVKKSAFNRLMQDRLFRERIGRG